MDLTNLARREAMGYREYELFSNQPAPTEEELQDIQRAACAKKGLTAPFDLTDEERKGEWQIVLNREVYNYPRGSVHIVEWDDMNHEWIDANLDSYGDSDVLDMKRPMTAEQYADDNEEDEQ